MSNKNRMMAGKMNRNHFRFSIRKLSIGAASVLLGLGFAGAAHQVANAATTSMSGIVHVNPVAAHPTWKIALYNGNGKFAHQYISANTNWKVFAKKSINGEDYYKIGNDSQWVKAEYVDASGATEVAVKAIYTVGSNPVNLVDGNGNATGASLPAGSRWKAFAKKTINGKVYYRLGTNKQWAPAEGGSLDGTVADEGSSTTANNGDYYEPINNDNTNPSKQVSMKVQFVDDYSGEPINNNPVTVYADHEGETVSIPSNLVPNGYELVYPDQKYPVRSGRTQLVHVKFVHAVVMNFKFVNDDPYGPEINKTVSVEAAHEGDLVSVPSSLVPNGYKLTYPGQKFPARNGQTRTIHLTSLNPSTTVSETAHFWYRAGNEAVGDITLTAAHEGDEVTVDPSKVPAGYKLANPAKRYPVHNGRNNTRIDVERTDTLGSALLGSLDVNNLKNPSLATRIQLNHPISATDFITRALGRTGLGTGVTATWKEAPVTNVAAYTPKAAKITLTDANGSKNYTVMYKVY